MRPLALFLLLFFTYLSSFDQEAALNEQPILTKAALGERLFFDKILSLDSTISCSSCHKPEFAFADTVVFSKGVGDSLGFRNTPSVMNLAYTPLLFYDGRSASLEEQAIGPIENPLEMHLGFSEAVKRVQGNKEYQQLFLKIYSSKPDSANILDGLATFQRTLESNGSAPHDLWVLDIDEDALTDSQLRGRTIFLEDGKCFDCHFGPFFTGDEFKNVGLYDGQEWKDSGRFEITKDSTDLGKFKVPSLRNVALTAPYMHDGRFATLEEVVEFYSDPYQFVSNPINIDTLMIKPMNFTAEEQTDLVNFMLSLTDGTFDYE
ncbi:MAG: cytochrome c peroxidase [Polaribacter sp.]|jgi:cytochrome c peroxidase